MFAGFKRGFKEAKQLLQHWSHYAMTKDVPNRPMNRSRTTAEALKLKTQVFLVLVLLMLTVAAAQPGFISIDCGSTRNYTDERGIHWSTDDGYIGTGSNVNVTVPESQVDNRQQLSTARYFQSDRKKFCYMFKNGNQSASYLIRTSFLYGNLSTPLPVSFSLAIDTTIFEHIEIGALEVDNLVRREYFVAASNEEIGFCLLPSKGNALISSLELRPLEPQMYRGYMFQSQFGVLTERLNCGADLTDPAIRFPEDGFDRIWETPNSSYFISKINTNVKLKAGEFDFDHPPLAVMQSAWQDYQFWFATNIKRNQTFYAGLYFAELRSLTATESTVIDIYLNDQIWYPRLELYPDKNTTQVWENSVYDVSILNFTIEANNILYSSAPALLNAFEIHMIFNANITTTASSDRQVLHDLRRSFNLMDWTGDPCLPVPWDWVSCTSDDPVTVTQIKLSNYHLRGTIPPTIGTLTALTDLWLDNNFITGSIPNLGGMTKLRTLHLQNNSLTGPIPVTLADIPLLIELFLQDNDCNGPIPAALANRSENGLNLKADGLPGGAPSSTPARTPGHDGGSTGLSTGGMAAIAAGGAFVAVLAIVCCRWKRRLQYEYDYLLDRCIRGIMSMFEPRRNEKLTQRPADIETLNDSVWELKRPNGDHGFDVIFFHGLQLSQSDLEEADWKTWLSRDGSVVWPKDWLGAKFPNSRIWSISYNSLAQKATEMRLEQITENLFHDIITFKNRDSPLGGAGQNRPVILVGHSLGGIVFKKLILYCIEKEALLSYNLRMASTVQQINNFLGNCKGVFFCSSPFGGSKLASYLRRLPARDTKLVGLLTVFDESANDINENFRPIRNANKLNIETFAVYESKRTKYRRISVKVVEEAALRTDVDNFYTARSADHIEVCKPLNEKDGIFATLENFILERCQLSESKNLTHDSNQLC